MQTKQFVFMFGFLYFRGKCKLFSLRETIGRVRKMADQQTDQLKSQDVVDVGWTNRENRSDRDRKWSNQDTGRAPGDRRRRDNQERRMAGI